MAPLTQTVKFSLLTPMTSIPPTHINGNPKAKPAKAKAVGKAKAKAAKAPASVGQRIEHARSTRGYTQYHLGQLLKISRAAISQYEKDIITPRPKVIERLAELFNAAPEWFSYGIGDAPTSADRPIIIPEIDLGQMQDTVDDPRALRVGRDWVLPGRLFEHQAYAPSHLVAFAAPNTVSGIHQGDWVIVDTLERAGPPGVFLCYLPPDPSRRRKRVGCALRSYDGQPGDALILGRVIVHLGAR